MKSELNTIRKFYVAFNRKNTAILNEICMPDWKDIPLHFPCFTFSYPS